MTSPSAPQHDDHFRLDEAQIQKRLGEVVAKMRDVFAILSEIETNYPEFWRLVRDAIRDNLDPEQWPRNGMDLETWAKQQGARPLDDFLRELEQEMDAAEKRAATAALFEYRVTKYDPAFRVRGAYKREEWISVSDIGKSFGGVVLTEAEYQRVEDAYITAALSFLSEAGLTELVVEGLEYRGGSPLPFSEGSVLRGAELGQALRRVLREEFWCRFEAPNGFIHVGYDYYMYVGVPQSCPESQKLVRELGLFAEPLESPYRRTESA
jgi:hypothetical protein